MVSAVPLHVSTDIRAAAIRALQRLRSEEDEQD